jgi:uncharacterized protein GlcG (DUF336 family)
MHQPALIEPLASVYRQQLLDEARLDRRASLARRGGATHRRCPGLRPGRKELFVMLATFPSSTQMVRMCSVLIGMGASVVLAVGGSGAFAQSAGPTTVSKQIITLDGANAVVSAAVAKAKELGVLEVIAVYDSTGILKALASVDGARVTSVTFAMDKAWTSARREAATQDLADALASQPAVNLPSFLKQPQLTLLGGGIPIVVNGQVVGGVGASGGTIAQDIEVASAGLVAIQH